MLNDWRPPEIDWMWQIHGKNPYIGFPVDDFISDLQGWGHQSPIFEHVISTYRPSRVVEVGTWKGASAIKIAGLMKDHHIVWPQLICVDTWLGSVEMWIYHGGPNFASLAHQWGRPALYNTFMANVVRAGHTDVIVPFPVDSSTGAKFLEHKKMQAGAIYLDASHEYQDVSADLAAYWKVLRPGGVFIGDDFTDEFSGVIRAVKEFTAARGLTVDTSFPGKFLIEKPAK